MIGLSIVYKITCYLTYPATAELPRLEFFMLPNELDVLCHISARLRCKGEKPDKYDVEQNLITGIVVPNSPRCAVPPIVLCFATHLFKKANPTQTCRLLCFTIQEAAWRLDNISIEHHGHVPSTASFIGIVSNRPVNCSSCKSPGTLCDQ